MPLRPPASLLFRVLTSGLLLATLAGCSLLHKQSSGDPAATPTPEASPSVWLSSGKSAAVSAASTDLIRSSDLPAGYKPSPLQLSSSKGVTPKACAAILGPAIALVDGSSGHAATSFVSSSTAIAQTVGVFKSISSASAVLDKAEQLGSTCSSMTAQNTKLTVMATRTTIHGQDAVVLTEKQKAGAEQITVLTAGKVTSVVAVAALPPGPDSDIVDTLTDAASQRLSSTPTPTATSTAP